MEGDDVKQMRPGRISKISEVPLNNENVSTYDLKYDEDGHEETSVPLAHPKKYWEANYQVIEARAVGVATKDVDGKPHGLDLSAWLEGAVQKRPDGGVPVGAPQPGDRVMVSSDDLWKEEAYTNQPLEDLLWRCDESFVVGIGVDFESQKVLYTINGKPVESLQDGTHLGEEDADAQLYPFVSGWNAGAEVSLNCGERPFKYPVCFPGVETACAGVANYATADLPALAAATQGHLSAVLVGMDGIIEKKLFNEKDRLNGRSLLWMVIESGGNLEMVRQLVDMGADARLVDGEGVPPIWVAANGGNEKVVTYLVSECKVDVDARPPHGGQTALMGAAQKGHGAVIKVLLEHGAGVNEADKDGATPLYIGTHPTTQDHSR